VDTLTKSILKWAHSCCCVQMDVENGCHFPHFVRTKLSSIQCHPVRIRVRIDPPHPHATDWGGPSDETGKTEVSCHSRSGTIKIPPCSKALSAEHMPKFCSPSPAMVTSSCKWKILERDVKP
jgi:hypothetical protein